jgi:TRAP-type mannitol/chloroaromatic compound transport system permease small subunit
MSGLIDGMNERIGRATIWLILIVVIISAGNAMSRFALNIKNEHIRIDVVVGRFSARTQNWIDVFGILVFLLPMAVLLAYLSWPVFTNAWTSGEVSQNPGGLVRWPVRLLMPVGFALLILQGVSELIKRVAFLTGTGPNSLDKEAGPSAEEQLAEEIKQRTLAEAAAQSNQGDRK